MADPAVPPTGRGRFRRDPDGRLRDERRRVLVSSMLADLRRFDALSKRPRTSGGVAGLDHRRRPAV